MPVLSYYSGIIVRQTTETLSVIPTPRTILLRLLSVVATLAICLTMACMVARALTSPISESQKAAALIIGSTCFAVFGYSCICLSRTLMWVVGRHLVVDLRDDTVREAGRLVLAASAIKTIQCVEVGQGSDVAPKFTIEALQESGVSWIVLDSNAYMMSSDNCASFGLRLAAFLNVQFVSINA